MRKSRADKISCLVFPVVAILVSLNCTASRLVEGAIGVKQVAKTLVVHHVKGTVSLNVS